MFKNLVIRNFKSVRKAELDLKRINILIGEPNTGKSNIAEALSFFAFMSEHSTNRLTDYIRLTELTNIFYDNITDAPVNLSLDQNSFTIGYDSNNNRLLCEGQKLHKGKIAHIKNDFTVPVRQGDIPELDSVKLYKFKDPQVINQQGPKYLKPPYGNNLFNVVFNTKRLRSLLQNYYKHYGLTLILKPNTKEFEVQKIEEGIAIAYPFQLSADTLRRMMFYEVAVESNTDSLLILEEPESFVFPYYLKLFGERIAINKENNNQYFIVTHNPYLLQAVIEKAPVNDIAVFATYYKCYETSIKQLSEDEIASFFEQDPFLSLDKLCNNGE